MTRLIPLWHFELVNNVTDMLRREREKERETCKTRVTN